MAKYAGLRLLPKWCEGRSLSWQDLEHTASLNEAGYGANVHIGGDYTRSKKDKCFMQMRPSRVLRKLRVGQVASCVKLNLTDPRVAEIAALCGLVCLWLDREHVPCDLSDIDNQIRAAKVHDVDTVVRVPRGSYSDLIYPLEMDAAGIMVPHVMNADDARRVIWQTRFHPVGRRPLDGGNSDAAYCKV